MVKDTTRICIREIEIDSLMNEEAGLYTIVETVIVETVI